ncbi:MAG: acyl-CoA dehydrogenase family protein [Bacteroidales bacterium]|nr:acyl-CoA dehydrogenase family protein [Bacteroidales bacterium]
MSNLYIDNEHLKFHLEHPMMEKIVRLKEDNFSEKDKYDYAPIDFEDTMDHYDKVLEIVGEISGDIIAANAEEVDHQGPSVVDHQVVYADGTKRNIEAIVQSKLFGMSLPRKYGGLNFPIVPYVMAAELVSRADAGFANIWGLQDCAETIHEFGSEEIKEKYLHRFNDGATAAMDLTEPDAGSDLQAVMLKAHYDDDKKTWFLNGVKRFITNGDADISLVLARTEEGSTDARGLSLFVYDRVDKAMKVRRIENKLGIKGSPTCELVFKDAPAELIGDRKFGLIKYVMSLMNMARLGVGAQSVGIAEAAYHEGLKYAKEREQFGKAIIKFPAIFEMLSNMRAKTDAIRTLLYETSRFIDIYKIYGSISQNRKLTPAERKEFKYYQRAADIYTPLLKLFASEYCNQIASDSLQIHGGTGYMKDFPIERIFRDARITNIYEGTSQLQVVAAIRGVGNKGYYNMMREYEKIEVKPELEYLKNILVKLTSHYTKAVKKVTSENDNEYLDFHARRLVEIAGNIITGYLLLLDANRKIDYKKSADIFIRKARAEITHNISYINNFSLRDISDFKM